MRKHFAIMILAALGCCMANADPMTWTLNKVQFAAGGYATGTFDYDPVTNAYSDVNLTTPNITYTIPPGSLVTSGDLASSATLLEVQNYSGWPEFELTLRFVGPGLTTAGGTVSIDVGDSPLFVGRVSRESSSNLDPFALGYYNISGGSVTASTSAVPEPSSVLLLLTVIGGAAGFVGMKRRK